MKTWSISIWRREREQFWQVFAQVAIMQFPPEFHAESRLMYYHPTSPHVLCSCSKCFQRNHPDYENLHFLQRQELEARERYMYSAHGLSLPSHAAGISATLGHAIDARHYYPATTLAAQLPHYPYDRDASEYGKSDKVKLTKL